MAVKGHPDADARTAASETARWRDSRLAPAERAAALIPLMTLEEKVAQLTGVWVGADASGGGVAPHQADMADGKPWSTVIRHGLGQLTRPFGTAPVDPAACARSLAAAQAQIMAASRFGIPAQVQVSVPRHSGGLPVTYLLPHLGHRTQVSSVDPTPAFRFGHGLSYTTFEWTGAGLVGQATGPGPATWHAHAGEPAEPAAWPADGEVAVQVTICNTGPRPGTEVVQLYLHDPVAQTTRPVVRLIGCRRVPLDPGESARVTFTVPADLASFTGVDGRRIVEPGEVELRFGRSSRDIAASVPLLLTGAIREAGWDRRLQPAVRVDRAPSPARSARQARP
jgi:Fibronectin type III-like domain